MKKFTAESYRHLLIVLFFLFETLLVASVVTIICFDLRRNPLISAAFGVVFLFSFVGQFVVSFLSIQTVPRLATIGWLSLFGSVLIELLFPRL